MLKYLSFRYLKNLLYVAFYPFTTPLAAFIFRRHALKQDHPAWRKELSQKKIVIIGTGPSFDRIPPKYFDQFDVAVVINDAVRFEVPIATKYYFSIDMDATKKSSSLNPFISSVKYHNTDAY
jgi:hypothetical protein